MNSEEQTPPQPQFTEEELIAADRARNEAKKRPHFTGKLTPREQHVLERERLEQEGREGPTGEATVHPWAPRYPFHP